MVAAISTVPVEQHRVTLRGEAVLVRINTDTGDTRKAEIEPSIFFIRRREASLLETCDNERPKTAVDVQRDLVRSSKTRQSRDFVDNAVRKVRGRTNKQDSVGVDQPTHGGDIDLVLRRGAGNTVQLDPKVEASFDECGMSSIGNDPDFILSVNRE